MASWSGQWVRRTDARLAEEQGGMVHKIPRCELRTPTRLSILFKRLNSREESMDSREERELEQHFLVDADW